MEENINRFYRLKKGDSLYCLIDKRINPYRPGSIYLLEEIEIVSELQIDRDYILLTYKFLNLKNSDKTQIIGFSAKPYKNPDSAFVNCNECDDEDILEYDIFQISDNKDALYPLYEKHNREMREVFEKGLEMLNQIECQLPPC